MKKLFAIVFALSLHAVALADSRVQMYVEEGDGIIALTVRCNADLVNECNCAIAGPGVVPSIDDAFMCWAVEGRNIIFTNDKYRFEKRLDDIKVRTIDPPASDVPPPGDPAPSRQDTVSRFLS